MSRETTLAPTHPVEEHSDRFLQHHFDSHEQQFAAGKLGMWLFLAGEVLFFSGLFCAYAILRTLHPESFAMASQLLDVKLGTINTAILLTSSLTMVWAVRCAQLNQRRGLILCLSLTLALAAIFLGVKLVEYSHKFHEGLLWVGSYNPQVETGTPPKNGVFFSVYFAMTGLHALHILGGMGAITWLIVRSVKGHFSSRFYGPVDFVGLYWHLVDIVWIYLFPLLYLIS